MKMRFEKRIYPKTEILRFNAEKGSLIANFSHRISGEIHDGRLNKIKFNEYFHGEETESANFSANWTVLRWICDQLNELLAKEEEKA